MPRADSARVLVWACLALMPVALALAGGLAIAQQQPTLRGGPASPATEPASSSAEAPAETPVPDKAAPKKREFRGRLPAYYGQVVDEKQREKIYAIQRDYTPKLDALKAQLDALTAERDEKIAAVLTPEQRQTVEKLQAESKAKRAAGPTKKSTSE